MSLGLAVAAAVAVALGATAAGISRGRPTRRGIWLAMLAAHALLGAGATLGAADLAGPAELFRLAAYPLLALALLRLAGRRHPAREGGALLDAALVGSAAVTMAGVFLILPAADDDALALPTRLAAIAFPVAAVVVLAVLTRLLTTRGVRTPAFRLVVAAALVAVVADVGAMLAARAPAGAVDPAIGAALHGLGPVACALLALAALHPSMTSLSSSTREGDDRLTAVRLGALGAAMLLAPTTLLAQATTGGIRHASLTAVGSIGVTALVLVRILGLYREVEAQHRAIAAIARADALTGLPNRRTWDFELARAAAAARERGSDLSVALLDLDRFKAYNDAHGHLAGDELLRRAAAAWRDALGRAGMLARYGGEEFAVLLPVDLAAARDIVACLRAVTPEGTTFSAGVARWDFLEDPAELLARADQALYAAKRGGRDRVVLAAPAAVIALR